MSCRPFSLSAIAFAALGLCPAHAQSPPLSLAVTVSTDLAPGSCGTADTIDITAGDQVNFCYTITNDAAETLAYHTLSDDLNGILFSELAQDVPPGASFQYNDVRVVPTTQTLTSTWIASTALANYETATGTADADLVFRSGFDSGEPPAYAFEDIAATGTDLALDDDGEATVDIGFDFAFYGEVSDRVRVGNNGGILFGVDSGELGYNNLPLPNATLGPAILPFWDDFDSEGGGVFAQTLGDAPHRRLVIEWKDRLHYNGATNTDPATFEAILFEDGNAIVFQYADVDLDGTEFDGGASATIGLNRGDRAAEYSYASASVAAGTAIRFTPTPVTSHGASDVVTINAGAPDISVDPAMLTAEVDAGASTSAPLAITNNGDRDLAWSIVEAPGEAAPPHESRVLARPRAPSAAASVQPQRQRPSVLLPPNKTDALPEGAGVPAFGVNLNILEGNSLIALDAADPGSTSVIGAVGRTAVGGAFLDDDFDTLYTLDFDTGELLTLDTTDADETVIGTAATLNGESWSGLALDRTSGILYASSTLMSGELSSTLYTIDPATGAADPIGAIAGGGRMIEIAVSPGGQLYGVDIAGDALVAIDKASGAATVIGPLGFNAEFAEGLDFDAASGVLYFAAVNDESVFSQPAQMYTVDPATGHANLIGGISADPAGAQVSAFAIAVAGGACATPADVPWLDVSPVSATTLPGMTSTATVAFDATSLDAGTYTATLCIASNDPDQSNVAVPVRLTVN
jgi:hypothetical protein